MSRWLTQSLQGVGGDGTLLIVFTMENTDLTEVQYKFYTERTRHIAFK